MDCANPFIMAGRAFGCGQCMPCRINRRRVWTHRIMLEALEHEYNSFVTLTYADENLPADGSVDSVTLQLFIKRLRKRYEAGGIKFRYYGCGEYGETGHRPHYHVALFGIPGCIKARQFFDGQKPCCPACDLVFQSWKLGRIQAGTLTRESAAYIAGYVTKKWIYEKDGYRPPFARMSNRPGIGAGAMDDVASSLLMAEFDGRDVPNAISHGGKRWPLGRYLVRRLRERMGREKNAPQSTLAQMDEALREVRAEAFEASKSFKEALIEKGVGRRARLEFWQRIRDQGKSL